jgi:D-alanine-D-alanine ligase
MNFNNCIILFGGSSEERFVSVASAQNLSSKIPEAKLWFLNKEGCIFVIPSTDLSEHASAFVNEFIPRSKALYKNVSASLAELKNQSVIIALHGTEGEDGALQKILEDQGIRFTGSSSQASSLAFDKKTEEEISKAQALLTQHKKIVLKPLANGSSVGLFIVTSSEELEASIAEIKSKKLGAYLAEPFITGREITVGVWEKEKGKNIALPCSEVRVLQGRQFDYEGKYLGDGVQELTPAPISEAETLACQKVALSLHQLVGCKGYSRTDLILTEKGPYLLEINTLPGLTKASFIPQQLAVIQVELRDFFAKQLDLI